MTIIVYSICLQFETHRYFFFFGKEFYLSFESCKMSVIPFGSMLRKSKGSKPRNRGMAQPLSL